MTRKIPVLLPELPNQENSVEEGTILLSEHDLKSVVGGSNSTSRPIPGGNSK